MLVDYSVDQSDAEWAVKLAAESVEKMADLKVDRWAAQMVETSEY